MKLLVVRFSSIGDIVLTTPVVRNIKKHFPHAVIHYITKEKYASILKANPYIDKVITIQKKIGEKTALLKSEKYDYIIDLHHNLRSSILKAKLLSLSFSFDKINLEKWLMVRFKKNLLPNMHIVERYMDVVKPFGVQDDQLGLDYFISEEDQVDFSLLPTEYRSDYIVFALGGTYNTKKLPLEKMIELCKNLSGYLILLGGKEDMEIGEKILAECKQNVYNGCGKFTVNESASIIKKAKCVITHDTGMMHIASAFKKDVISIWGNTIPEFGMYPYKAGSKSIIFEVDNLDCRPCSKLGYDKCPKKHFKCMQDINIGKVVQYVNSM